MSTDKLECCNQTPCAHPGVGPCNRPAKKVTDQTVNQIGNGPRLGLVAMPLVELMAVADLSWHCRERIAEALFRTIGHWKDMERERFEMEQRMCQGQQRPSADR